MLNCKTVSELTSVDQHRSLSLFERVSMTIHRMICAPCSAYKKQMDVMNEQLFEIKDVDIKTKTVLSDDARRRIQEKLRQGS